MAHRGPGKAVDPIPFAPIIDDIANFEILQNIDVVIAVDYWKLRKTVNGSELVESLVYNSSSLVDRVLVFHDNPADTAGPHFGQSR